MSDERRSERCSDARAPARKPGGAGRGLAQQPLNELRGPSQLLCVQTLMRYDDLPPFVAPLLATLIALLTLALVASHPLADDAPHAFGESEFVPLTPCLDPPKQAP